MKETNTIKKPEISKKVQEKKELTFKFLKAFIEKYKYPPSVREICHTVGFKSTASAQFYLNLLEEDGRIMRSSCKNRTIKIVEENSVNNDNYLNVPYLGNIAAGQPLGAAVVNNVSYIVSTDYFNINKNNNYFLLNIKGNSMIEIGINNDDLVLIKQENIAENGQIIAVQIDNEDVTLKRFYKESNKIILHPENSNMDDIIIDSSHSIKILGVLVGLMRNKF